MLENEKHKTTIPPIWRDRKKVMKVQSKCAIDCATFSVKNSSTKLQFFFIFLIPTAPPAARKRKPQADQKGLKSMHKKIQAQRV